MWQVRDRKTGRNSVAACHPIRVVFRGNCPCVREGPCRTPVAPRRRLTSGGGMRRASGTGLRVSQVSFAPEKRRTCTRPLSGGRTPPAYPGERRCRGRIRRVFTRRMAWRNTACAPCTQIRLSAAAPLLPTWDASCPASRKRSATKADRWCACGQDSSREGDSGKQRGRDG